MYKIAKENLTALFRLMAAERDIYAPVNNGGQVNFEAWAEGAEVDLDTLKSVKSPKDAFFPQSENLYTCYRDGKKITIKFKGKKFKAKTNKKGIAKITIKKKSVLKKLKKGKTYKFTAKYIKDKVKGKVKIKK